MKNVYIFYRINKYPDYGEASERADAVFSDKRSLLKAIKKAREDAPVLYQESDYIIRKVAQNKFFEL